MGDIVELQKKQGLMEDMVSTTEIGVFSPSTGGGEWKGKQPQHDEEWPQLTTLFLTNNSFILVSVLLKIFFVCTLCKKAKKLLLV